jgi:transglutaminase-like putative cysteine protease
MTGIPGTVGKTDWTLPRAPGRPKSRRRPWLDRVTIAPLALRAFAFFSLAFFAAAHWTALVQPAQTGRAFLVAMITTAGGVLIALSGKLLRVPGLISRVLLLVLMLLLAATAIGIRFKLLMPAGWGTLGDRITGGLSVVSAVTEWPYTGPNVWLRLTTLLAVPLVLVLASAFVFWPRPRQARPVYRGFALILLVALYAVAVAARPFDHQALRGIGLLFCLAAWIWIPRLRGRDAAAAATAIGIALVAALLLTPRLASGEPWVDYHQWSWTLHKERTIAYDWRPGYGPLHWPRKGRALLLIKSREPHYWKAETLDRFDGRGWSVGQLGDTSVANGAIQPNPKWFERVQVTVRGLRSDMIIGPGSLLQVDGAPGEAVRTSYGTALASGELTTGDSYTAVGYTPDPSVKEMRAAHKPAPFFGRYTTLSLDHPGGFVSVPVRIPLRDQPSTGDPGAVSDVAHSRYKRVYDLARRVAGGATTNYDIVRRIGSYLEGHYTYSERVPNRAYPLEAFLFQDKKGYCQHFSGAAALMLRLLGVPVRVATGFAPGTVDTATREYVVRDLDAHSWIEVWFQGIGWVPFDPTPALAPASSQAASFTPFSEVASAARGDSKDKLLPKLREQIIGATKGGGASKAANQHSTPWGWIALGAVATLLALAAVVVTLLRMRRRKPLPPPSGDPDVDHLVRLLSRLGLEIPPGTTLLELENRMQRLGGAQVAGYAQRLRRRRFSSGGEPAPGRAERRQLRHALAGAVNAGPFSRLHLAMPDNLGIRWSALNPWRSERSH